MDSQDAQQHWPNTGISDSYLNPDSKHILEVFGTQKILKRILENLKGKELLYFRSLNREWNAAACDVLCKRNSLYIPIHFPCHPRNVSEEEFSMRAETNFELLTKAITRGTELNMTFPTGKFIFYQLNLQNAAIQNFLSNCGHVVTKMHAVFPFNSTNETDPGDFIDLLMNLLFNQLPNLSQLFIVVQLKGAVENEPEHFEQFYSLIDSPQEARVLPKLKRLKCSSYINSSILKGILKAAVNLEEIRLSVFENGSERNIKDLIDLGKAHLLSYLSLLLDKGNLDLVESLSETKMPIKKLNLSLRTEMSDEWRIKAGHVVNKLFHSVAQSLEKLESQPFLLYSTLNVPQMPKLHSLKIIYIGPCHTLFPTNFKMSVTFPQLKSLKIFISVCERLDSGLFNESFLGASYADEVVSLKSIEFNQQPPDLCMQNLPRMFPNIVSLNMGALFNIPLAFEAFWSLTHLKKLEMVVIRGSKDDEGFDFEKMGLELEAGLTGFPTETCEQMAADFKKVDLATVESLRVNRSMLDAKNLRELYIRVADCFEEERTFGRSPLFSDATGQFAFKMCPQVRVYIEVYAEDETNLASLMSDVQSVLGFVTSVTKSDDDCLPESSMRFLPCWVCKS